MVEKQRIRKQIQKQRDKLSQEFISTNSTIIREKLINMEEYKNAETIYIYMNFNKEVETRDIILPALENHKKVAIPKIIDNSMKFYYINNINDTVKGKWRNTRAKHRDCTD